MESLKACFCFFSLFGSTSAAVFSTQTEDNVESFIEASMKCHHIPGMTLSVVKGDEVWIDGFGTEDFSTGHAVDADSKFNIGSITKAFTATLLGILLSEKRLDWTAKVTSILGPGYEFTDPYRTKELTLRDLLSHRTGLARLDFGLESGIPPSISTSKYCNLRPIGSAGAILSTATDMAKWVKFNLKLGQTETGKQLIDQRLMKDMRRLITAEKSENELTKPEFPVDYMTSGYGYAWFISEYRGYRLVEHSGGLFSYISLLWTFPDEGFGIFASVNGPGYGKNSGYHNAVSLSFLTDRLLDLEPWLNHSTACTFPKPWRNDTYTETEIQGTPLHVGNLSNYEGFYGNHLFADVVVYSNRSILYLNSNHIYGVLHPSSEKDKFHFEITYPWEFISHENNTQLPNITFTRDETTGLVTALSVELEVNLTYIKGESLFDVTTKSDKNTGGQKPVKSAGSPLEIHLLLLWIGLIISAVKDIN